MDLDTAPPNTPTDADLVGLEAAMRLELAARDLYLAAVAAVGATDQLLMQAMADNHAAYAQSIAGAAGLSASGRNDDVYGALEAAFSASSVSDIARAAYDLESQAVATHTALLGSYEGLDSIELTASILVVEARHAAVLAAIAGLGSDLDALLVNTAQPLALTESAA